MRIQPFSVSPPPVRRKCSMPKSRIPRPCEKMNPVPAETPSWVGAVGPGPKGIWPPRTPIRTGSDDRPNSPPTDQLVVLKAVPEADDTDQFAWVSAPATFTSGVTVHWIAAPKVVGRSFFALWNPLTSARRRLYDRRNPERSE